MDQPLVSVCIMTYNHAKYIREALDSVLMQKVDFFWEIIIADDYSTDGAREIIMEYQAKHPNLIKLILQEHNVGPLNNWIQLLSASNAQYVAYLEGDDYWLDEYKLQMQYDLLAVDQSCNAVFTNVVIIDQEGNKKKNIYNMENGVKIHWIDLLSNGKYMKISSIMYRNSSLLTDSMRNGFPCDETSFGLFLLESGQYGIYLNRIACTYRAHPGGAWSMSNNYQRLKIFSSVEEKIMQRYIELSPGNKEIVEKRYFASLCRILSAAITQGNVKNILVEIKPIISKMRFNTFYIKHLLIQVYLGTKLFVRSVLIKK